MEHIDKLSIEDLNIINESLTYTKLKFEDYQHYPLHEYKLKRVEEINRVIEKVKFIIKIKKA